MINFIRLWTKKSVASENALGDKAGFWSTFGPAFLIVSLCLALLKFAPDLSLLLLFSSIGFILCSKWRFQGLWISLIAIAAAAFLQIPSGSGKEILWWASLNGSLIVGLLLTALGRNEADYCLIMHNQEVGMLDQKITSLQKALKEAQLFSIQEKSEVSKELTATRQHLKESLEQTASYQKLLHVQQDEIVSLEKKEEMLKAELFKHVENISFLHKTIETMQIEIDCLKDAKSNQSDEIELLNQLNQSRMQEYQLSVLKDDIEKQSQRKDLQLNALKEELNRISNKLKNSLEQENVSFADQLQKNTQMERNYRQLKMQFEEKSEILHQTRKELFHVEGQLIALQKECEFKLLDVNPEEAILIDHLKEIEGECRFLETQLSGLQDLVTELISKKKLTKSRKIKNKEPVPEQHLNLSF